MVIFIPVWSIFAYFRAYFPIFWYFYPIFGTLHGLYISGTILWKKLRQFEPYFTNHFGIRASWSHENTKIGYIVWKKNTLGHLKRSKVRKHNFFVTSTTKLTWENYESWWFQRGSWSTCFFSQEDSFFRIWRCGGQSVLTLGELVEIQFL